MDSNSGFSVDASLYAEDVLVALGDADNALAFVPELALNHPHTLDGATPELLTRAIAADVPNAAIQKLVIVDRHDGMTSRRRWAIEWNHAGQDAGLPTAFFAKATPAIDYHRKSIAILHLHEGESNYYRHLHGENPGLAPDVLYNGCYPGGRFLREAKPEELPEGARSRLQIWAANADAVFGFWETSPPTVLHGDSHLGNTSETETSTV